MSKIKVGVIGTGTIGHRVIAYGARQKDIKICGVSKTTPNGIQYNCNAVEIGNSYLCFIKNRKGWIKQIT